MKPYFANWLPVEGEIKIGDKYINTVFKLTPPYRKGGSCYAGHVTCGNYLVETRKENQTGTFTFSGRDKYKKRVKLFLCSRDIKVGDKIYCTDPADKEPILREWTEHIDFDIPNSVSGKDVRGYKVIGEISPEATWVKDGDEFDEGQIQQDSELYGWNKEYNTKKDFQKFFNKSLSKTSTHFVYEGETDYLDEAGTINLNFRVYKKVYKIKGPCGYFH